MYGREPRPTALAAAGVLPLLLAALASAAVPMRPALAIERLAGGNTVIAIGGSVAPPGGLIIEVDSLGQLVWAYVRADIPWAHSGRRLPNGNTLITATLGDRVLEVDRLGNTVWQLAEGLCYPNEAFRLSNGNTLITDRDNSRVIEADSAGSVVWSYTALNRPHHGSRLPDGNTLVCNSEDNQVIEVTPAGEVVWQYGTGLRWPRSAQRLAGGHTLLTDTYNRRVIELDSANNIVWTYSTGSRGPYMAVRLANGNTLVSSEDLVVEVSPALSIVWQYPPLAPVVETCRVVNPSSGCSLYVHVHRPPGSGPDRRIPAVILVPDEVKAGTTFDSTQLADHLASDGFAVLHFDAEGRGLSLGAEDYSGRVHQDGLHACLEFLARQSYVDTSCLGIYAQGYGVVMATGMLARHESPRVKFLLDWEGPSDRYQVCADSGGHVPVSPDSGSFWSEREAARFIKHVACAYLRIQSELDHTNRIPDKRHAIALVDSATAVRYGGAGRAVWTRVNDSVMNPENRVYTVAEPPVWIDDIEEGHLLCRELLYLHELADPGFPGIGSPPGAGIRPSALSVFPNPCHGKTTIASPLLSVPGYLRVFTAAGRLVHSGVHSFPFALGTSSFAPGVYLLRLEAAGRFATARLIRY